MAAPLRWQPWPLLISLSLLSPTASLLSGFPFYCYCPFRALPSHWPGSLFQWLILRGPEVVALPQVMSLPLEIPNQEVNPSWSLCPYVEPYLPTGRKTSGLIADWHLLFKASTNSALLQKQLLGGLGIIYQALKQHIYLVKAVSVSEICVSNSTKLLHVFSFLGCI